MSDPVPEGAAPATEEVYREDAYRRETPASVMACDEKGIVLDRTVFYPRGGGQAGDAGVIVRADGSEVAIADTIKSDGAIVHVPAAPASIPPGENVTARIDWEKRHRHMRFHTATHLLCAIVPHQTNGCSITRDYARLDFDMVEPLEREHLERELARLVDEAHDVRTIWITDEELDAKPELVRTMSVKPPRGVGRVRLLEIDGVDLQPCGGTHVANTREIGRLRIAKIEKKSARTRRVVLEFA
jgi:misacylated tRNA(Ala) deacylase